MCANEQTATMAILYKRGVPCTVKLQIGHNRGRAALALKCA